MGLNGSVFQLDLRDLPLLGALPQAPEDRLQQLDTEKQRDRDESEDDGCGEMSQADQGSKGGEDPDDGCGRDSDDGALAGENHSPTQKSDAGDDLGQRLEIKHYPVLITGSVIEQ